METVCSACGAQRVTGKFCSECGASLATGCPACGAAVTGKFCSECGTALLGDPGAVPVAGVAAAATPTTERRMCAVLFGDLVGFTPLSESRDPEIVRELLSRYFETARTVITRYGGVVEKFIGDAVMAVWGTPVATEGDAERAVRAGLDLVAAVELLGAEVGAEGLALRAGIVTGEVAVNLRASGEGMVAGDAVNTAARVQSVAEPGQVWVDEQTKRLTVAAIALDDVGAHVLKGKSGPVQLFRATRVLAGVGGSQRVDGLEAPLVGRNAELRLLKDAFHATAERRTPRLVVVSGPAGAGKSRLGWEFEKYIDGLAEVTWWHRGRCLSYGEGIAYRALAEMIRQRFAIADEDPLDVAATKLSQQLSRFVHDEAEQAYIGPRLARLLGVTYAAAADAAFSRDELFAGWRLFFERLAVTGPVVLLVEDAQYADTALLDFVDHLTDWARNAPIYVVVFGRQELIDQRPGFGVGRNRSLVALDLLDPRSMDTMVDALVPGMPADAVATITAQAQGNPLFAIETVRALIDRDVVVPREGRYVLVGDVLDLGVPDSLHGLLAARLDALAPEARSLLADAAVLGTSFPSEALVAVSGRPADEVETILADLVRRGVLEISADPLSPQSGAYVFAQNLLRQVAYDTVSRRERKARHLAVAAHLQVTFDGDEIMDVVARHYLDALACVENDIDDDEIRAKACDALVRAAEHASATGAPRRASAQFARVAELVAESSADPGEAAALWERAAGAARTGGDHDAQYQQAERAHDLYSAAGRTREAARAATVMGVALGYQGQLRRARELLEPAVEQMRTVRDADTVSALRELASVLMFEGEAERGADLAREALWLGQALGEPDSVLADLLVVSGISGLFLNRFIESEALLSHAIRLAERADDTLGLSRALMNLSAMTIAIAPASSVQYSQRSYELSRLIGATLYMKTSLINMSSALILAGDWDGAEHLLRQAMDDDGMDVEEEVRANWAALAALRGDLDTARDHADAEELRRSDDGQIVILVACLDALIAYADERPEQAIAHARRMLDFVNVGLSYEHLMLSWSVMARSAYEIGDLSTVADLVGRLAAQAPGHIPPLLRGELALHRTWLLAADGGDDEAVARGYADAITQLRAFGSPYHLGHALVDEARHLRAMGRTDEADAAIAEAAGIAERLGARPLASRAETASASRPVG